MKSHIIGVTASFLALCLQSLHSYLSAAEGQDVSKITIATLQSLRCESNFDLFWQKIDLALNEEVDVNEPELPRRRRIPQRFEVGSGEPSFGETPKQFYRRFYYESLDLVINSISDRFNQKGYQTYKHVEDILLKAAQGQEYHAEFKFVVDFIVQTSFLPTLTCNFNPFVLESDQKSIQLKDVLSYLKSLSEPQRVLYSEVVVLATLILVMPATNAGSERSFSALKRIKNYLRATMSKTRLNSLMFLHVHNDMTDKLNLCHVANTFVSNRPEHRFNTLMNDIIIPLNTIIFFPIH